MPSYSPKRKPNIHSTPFLRASNMPSPRRVKVLAVVVFVIVITTLLYTGSHRSSRETNPSTLNDFYTNTVKGLDKNVKEQEAIRREDEEVQKKMQEQLSQAAKLAKDNANAKAPKPDPPSKIVGVGSAAEGAREEKNVAGRVKYGAEEKPIKVQTKEELDVELELNTIFQKSPIVVFSKSYCPHSKRAKSILAKYIIDPAPFIVELDQHPLGPGLQNRLAELTGRRTVPNVLIEKVTIGGGDDVAALDDSNKLLSKIKELGGKKILKIEAKAE